VPAQRSRETRQLILGFAVRGLCSGLSWLSYALGSDLAFGSGSDRVTPITACGGGGVVAHARTKGRPGGKEPFGNLAVRPPPLSLSAASRDADDCAADVLAFLYEGPGLHRDLHGQLPYGQA